MDQRNSADPCDVLGEHRILKAPMARHKSADHSLLVIGAAIMVGHAKQTNECNENRALRRPAALNGNS